MQNHFARLGLPGRFAIDPADLERQYLARSREVHPDYHAAGASADLAASLELSAAVNEAYNTLRDPLARADYLLTLEGGPSAADDKQVPQAFLMEMMELRERLEEALAAGADDNPAVAALATEFADREAGFVRAVGEGFAEYEGLSPDDPRRADIRTRIRGLLNGAKYVRGLIRDLRPASG